MVTRRTLDRIPLGEKVLPLAKVERPDDDSKDSDADKNLAQIYLISFPTAGEGLFPSLSTDEEVHAFLMVS